MRDKKDVAADSKFDRATTESKENLKEIVTDVPEAKFQGKQQIAPADNAIGMEGAGTTYGKKKRKVSGTQLKQDIAAKVISGATGGDIPSSATGLRGISYSGDGASNVVGDASSTPIVGRSDRSSTRLGKRFDSTAKHLDQIPSEQIEVEFAESKPLAENDSTQGYNGTYHNAAARVQKKSGKVPADLMFVRSLDEIKRDHLYFSAGQVVKGVGTVWHDTPDITMVKNARGQYEPGEPGSYSIKRGNFLHRAMHVTFHKDGYVSKVAFDVDDLSTENVSNDIANMSAVNGIIDVNCAEIDRQNIDTKAGDEKADIWSPLARAIANPSQTVGYLRDLELMTGSEIFMSYKKTAHCMSYQLNRAAKDGIKQVSPAIEAALGLINDEASSLDYADKPLSTIFSAENYLKGASSLIIGMHDSIGKYTSKSKLLMMPLSYRHALQTADNNMDVFRLKPEFAAVVNAEEVFSTIDRDYDPTLPVCVSDRAGIIHPYNFNDLFAFEATGAAVSSRTFVKDPFVYSYNDLRNRYVVTASFPLIAGLVDYLNQHAGAIYKLLAGKNGTDDTYPLTIPMIHSTCYFSLWSLMVLEAIPYIQIARTNAMKDVLYYEKNVEYPFSQLRTIKELNPVNAMNFSYTSYDEPLKTGRMLPSTALKWVMPELFIPMDEEASDNTFKCILPWYFNQEQYIFDKGRILGTNDLGGVMSMPSFRSGVHMSFADLMYSMDERDLRLCLDRMVTPTLSGVVGADATVYKYGLTTDGIPCVTFSGSGAYKLTYGEVLAAPRELGWFMVAPAGILSTINGSFVKVEAPMYGRNSYRAKYWFGRGLSTNININTIEDTQVNIDRASSFKQDWNCIKAWGRDNSMAPGDPGFVLSLGELFTYANNGDVTLIDGKSKFIPFSYGSDGQSISSESVVLDDSYAMMSMQKALWARLQLLPFMLSPFDVRAVGEGVGEDGVKFDPFDFMYYFNCAGFRASDYNEDIYNRMTQKANQGWLFVEDPFSKDSPLFNDAVKYTSV